MKEEQRDRTKTVHGHGYRTETGDRHRYKTERTERITKHGDETWTDQDNSEALRNTQLKTNEYRELIQRQNNLKMI